MEQVVDEKVENIVSNEIKENLNGDALLKSNETDTERTCTGDKPLYEFNSIIADSLRSSLQGWQMHMHDCIPVRRTWQKRTRGQILFQNIGHLTSVLLLSSSLKVHLDRLSETNWKFYLYVHRHKKWHMKYLKKLAISSFRKTKISRCFNISYL
jgi:hypothetical protein